MIKPVAAEASTFLFLAMFFNDSGGDWRIISLIMILIGCFSLLA